MTVQSVPHLLARAKGTNCVGPHSCFYCGAPCDDSYPVVAHVRDTFTARSTVRCPGSTAICQGCVFCWAQDADLIFVDGTTRSQQKVVLYSWVITSQFVRAATKAHINQLRELCLAPPTPPYAIVLSDSGQKHLLYQGVVNNNTNYLCVTIEGEPITYQPHALQARLNLIGPLVAATGKPALAEPITTRFGMAVMERYPKSGEQCLLTWERMREEPLSRLAAWLSPNKEVCHELYPAENGL